MKKALLILPMLAGISAAATTDVFDFGRSDSITANAINISKGMKSDDATKPSDDDPTPSTGVLTNLVGSYTITYVKDGENVGNGGTAPTLTEAEESGHWKENFKGPLPFNLAATFADSLLAQTNTNNAAITLTFTGLKAGTYTLSAFGGYYGQDAFNNLTAELSTTADWTTQKTSTTTTGGIAAGTWETAVTSTGVNSYNFNNSSSSVINHGYALTAENIAVGENGRLVFTIKGVGGSAYGRTPLNYLALTQVASVPEPATATLGLLALAGLAMRRRRK